MPLTTKDFPKRRNRLLTIYRRTPQARDLWLKSQLRLISVSSISYVLISNKLGPTWTILILFDSVFQSLKDMLVGTLKGRLVQQYYNLKQTLTDEYRKILVEEIVLWFREKGMHMGTKSCEAVSIQISEHFPSENKVCFFVYYIIFLHL